MVPAFESATITEHERTSLTALNETLREDYIADCAKGVERWNRILAEVGAELRLPHIGFNRHVGVFAGQPITPDGNVISEGGWKSGMASEWIPIDADKEYVQALMTGIREPGKMASWIAPPATGIHAKPIEFEYVRT